MSGHRSALSDRGGRVVTLARCRGRWVLALVLLTLSASAAAARGEAEKPMREAIWAGQFLAGIRAYEALVQSGVTPSPQAAYLAGFAYWKLHQPENAEPLLALASRAGFQAGAGRPQPAELLAKVAAFIAAQPPAIDVPGLDRSVIDARAYPQTSLSAPILDALPRIAEIGKQIFGQPPPVRFLLFASSEGMAYLYDTLEIRSQRSTGLTNLVVVCEEKAHRATPVETQAIALHETVHAWMHTYLRARYDRDVRVPTYVDEGVAVYVASLWSADLKQAPERIRKLRLQGARAPEFDKLKAYADFHGADDSLHYLLAGLLVERLLGPASASANRLPAVFDALATEGDDVRAWQSVSGKDVRAEYAALVDELWKPE